jgi:hypothetical protein
MLGKGLTGRGLKGLLWAFFIVFIVVSPQVGSFNVPGLPDGIFNARRGSVTVHMRTKSGPLPGEVRNPWGRAGKPETRAARLKEQEESVELRTK